MKIKASFFLFIVMVLLQTTGIGQSIEAGRDTLSRRQRTKFKREEFRKNNPTYFLKLSAVNANLKTGISFDLVDGLFSANLGLEDNLGLPGKRTFFTASFVHRFTPASGMYVNYYGIDRNEITVTDKDLIFGSDTIPKGTTTQAFFNTQVISAGYLLSLMEDPNAYLGAYINVYLMWLDTGVKSDFGSIDENISYAIPLPNFGLLAMFKLRNWLYLDCNIGFFTLRLDDFDGTIFDFSGRLVFKPAKWIGLSVNYQIFDIRVKWPFEGIGTSIDYNFKCPGLGAIFSF